MYLIPPLVVLENQLEVKMSAFEYFVNFASIPIVKKIIEKMKSKGNFIFVFAFI